MFSNISGVPMATKTEKAVKRAFVRGEKQGKIREEKHVLGLLVAIILVLLFLLFAQHFGWWPYSRPKLGTAFYTNVSATTPAKTSTGSTAATGSSSGSSAGSGSTTTTGSTGGSTTSGTTGSGGGSTTGGSSGSSSTQPIASFAAGVDVGNTAAQTSAQATGLSQNCSIVANVGISDANLGQQQVCVYTQGDKIVTVTYLNGRVISASKSGF